MIQHPKISVVMTVYNAVLYLKEAVESILNQTFKDFEFIIVDNNSHDGSREIVASYRDDRIIFIENKENLGQTKALNRGIHQARSPYIARMDADDIAYPHRLQKQFDFLEHNPSIAVVGSWRLDINKEGRALKIYKVPADPFLMRCYLCCSGDLSVWCVNHAGVMIRKAVLEEVGFYNEAKSMSGYPQDYELWMKIIRRYGIGNIAEPLFKYRILDNSESRGFMDNTLRFRREITATKIKWYIKGLTDKEIDSLGNMLEYQPLSSKEDGRRVLVLFDRYFSLYMGNLPKDQEPVAKKAAHQIKLYYLPVLFLTNPLFSCGEFLKIIFSFPSLLFDSRFYRKMAKVFLKVFLSDKQYQFLDRKILLHG